MVVYKVAQLGAGWAVFRIDDRTLMHVDGPYRNRHRALARKRSFEFRDTTSHRETDPAGVPAFDE
jgi:hypothetical protein